MFLVFVRNLPAAISEEDVVCFPEYMEMWMHSARIEEFRVWLSRALSIQGISL